MQNAIDTLHLKAKKYLRLSTAVYGNSVRDSICGKGLACFNQKPMFDIEGGATSMWNLESRLSKFDYAIPHGQFQCIFVKIS